MRDANFMKLYEKYIKSERTEKLNRKLINERNNLKFVCNRKFVQKGRKISSYLKHGHITARLDFRFWYFCFLKNEF